MDEKSWSRLLGQIREGFVVPIAGCQLLVDACGTSVQAQVAQELLSAYGEKVGDEQLPTFRELNEAVTRLRATRLFASGEAKLQDLYADVDEAILKVTTAKDFVTPLPIRLLSEITDFQPVRDADPRRPAGA
jgi:hypothetical protein